VPPTEPSNAGDAPTPPRPSFFLFFYVRTRNGGAPMPAVEPSTAGIGAKGSARVPKDVDRHLA
jgi:hypothetical protein